jgi:hypothetical protein
MINEKKFPNLICRLFTIASLISFVVYVSLVISSTSPDDDDIVTPPPILPPPPQVSIPIQNIERPPQQPVTVAQTLLSQDKRKLTNQKRREAVRNVTMVTSIDLPIDRHLFTH